MEALGGVLDWFWGLHVALQVVIGVCVGLGAWWLSGLPFGIRASAQSDFDRLTEKVGGRGERVFHYIMVVILTSFVGPIGTGYLIVRWTTRRFSSD